jgi:hypothetical protein
VSAKQVVSIIPRYRLHLWTQDHAVSYTARTTLGVIVSRSSFAVLAFTVGIAACQDALTSPQLNVDEEGLFANASNPPPPPIDTGAIGRFRPGTNLRAPYESPLLQPRFSIIQSSAPQQKLTVLSRPQKLAFFVQTSENFSVPVKYTLSTDGTRGELIYKATKVSKEVLKTCTIKYVNGVFSGKGTLQIVTEDGLLWIDCSSVSQSSTFDTCGEGETCFDVIFDNAILYPNYPSLEGGIPGSAETQTGCPPENTDEGCPSFEEDD